jgi:hypothetical protein
MKTNILLLLLMTFIPLRLFSQTETVTDIDGNTYHTIKNGKQTWMTENLRTTRLNDGSKIPLVTNNLIWMDLKQPAYCWYNNNENKNKGFGALYNWYTVETGKLCPVGWHVPSDKSWYEKAPESMGYRETSGFFRFVPSEAYYWTSSECSLTDAYYQSVLWDGSEVTRDFVYKTSGFSVRCIKNEKY